MSNSIERIEVSQKAAKEKTLLVKEPFSREAVLERFETLRPREKEVARLLVAGNMSKDIASYLCLSPATVKVHKARMMTKMQVSSLQELVFAFIKSDLV
jgi:FixJ family two-component response regulator